MVVAECKHFIYSSHSNVGKSLFLVTFKASSLKRFGYSPYILILHSIHKLTLFSTPSIHITKMNNFKFHNPFIRLPFLHEM